MGADECVCSSSSMFVTHTQHALLSLHSEAIMKIVLQIMVHCWGFIADSPPLNFTYATDSPSSSVVVGCHLVCASHDDATCHNC